MNATGATGAKDATKRVLWSENSEFLGRGAGAPGRIGAAFRPGRAELNAKGATDAKDATKKPNANKAEAPNAAKEEEGAGGKKLGAGN